ncbi:hypothetical protein RSSM_03776 [Rhodopirellula sallentina SM41]|uniref:Uncharacterized protein n=1 Tax=Rhodopirellula sallentina SM41 TaxID=1263870 RepID=M5TZY0_9BACT|nr:hypothetical protein RSSM_03776 [Rhodopirellula sallentina SM41]
MGTKKAPGTICVRGFFVLAVSQVVESAESLDFLLRYYLAAA